MTWTTEKPTSSSEWRLTGASITALVATLLVYPGFRVAAAYLDLLTEVGGRAEWWSLWGVMLVGHWLCAALVLSAVASETRGLQAGGLRSIGLDLGFFRRHRFLLLSALTVACGVAWLAPSLFYGGELPERMHSHPLGPVTSAQRVFWVAMALTAGIVEEVVYRGYALTRLRRLVGLPFAFVLALASFALIHGPSAFVAPTLTLYLVSGSVFVLLFLRWRCTRLEWLIVAHAALDLLLVALP